MSSDKDGLEIKPKRRKTTEEEKKIKCEDIIKNIATGLSMYKSCKEAGVDHSTFMLWVSQDSELADNYARAKSDGIEKMASDLLDICDAEPAKNSFGSVDSGAVAAKRLQVDTRKWLLSKLAPRKYGEKLEISGDAENPLSVDLNVMTDAQLLEIINKGKKSDEPSE